MTTPTDDNILEFKPASGTVAFTVRQPPVNVTFTNPNGEVVGEFKYSNETKKWSFKGDMDESAERFMEFLLSLFDQSAS